MPQFHETRMGQKFFCYDVPQLIKGMERMADKLEKLEKRLEKQEQKESKGNKDEH